MKSPIRRAHARIESENCMYLIAVTAVQYVLKRCQVSVYFVKSVHTENESYKAKKSSIDERNRCWYLSTTILSDIFSSKYAVFETSFSSLFDNKPVSSMYRFLSDERLSETVEDRAIRKSCLLLSISPECIQELHFICLKGVGNGNEVMHSNDRKIMRKNRKRDIISNIFSFFQICVQAAAAATTRETTGTTYDELKQCSRHSIISIHHFGPTSPNPTILICCYTSLVYMV